MTKSKHIRLTQGVLREARVESNDGSSLEEGVCADRELLVRDEPSDSFLAGRSGQGSLITIHS